MHFKVVQISKGWTSSSREQVDVVEAPTSDDGDGEGGRARWVYKYTGLLAAIGGVSSVRETVRTCAVKCTMKMITIVVVISPRSAFFGFVSPTFFPPSTWTPSRTM